MIRKKVMQQVFLQKKTVNECGWMNIRIMRTLSVVQINETLGKLNWGPWLPPQHHPGHWEWGKRRPDPENSKKSNHISRPNIANFVRRCLGKPLKSLHNSFFVNPSDESVYATHSEAVIGEKPWTQKNSRSMTRLLRTTCEPRLGQPHRSQRQWRYRQRREQPAGKTAHILCFKVDGGSVCGVCGSIPRIRSDFEDTGSGLGRFVMWMLPWEQAGAAMGRREMNASCQWQGVARKQEQTKDDNVELWGWKLTQNIAIKNLRLRSNN